MTLNDEIKAFRTQYDMTQAELAFALGVSVGTISHWERGGKVGSPGMVRTALTALKWKYQKEVKK